MPCTHTDSLLPPDCFRGRTIVITGGGTGLGFSMGRYLLQLGAHVVICGRRAEVLEKAASALGAETGGEVLAQRCDVRVPEQVDALLQAALTRFGGVHGLVNNAAGNFICPTERLSYNAFHTVIDIVLRGTVNCTLCFGKHWIAQQQPGAFVNIVTTYAWTGSGFVVPSATAKGGVLALTRSLGSEWGKYGIRTNAIAPGPFPTEGAWSRLVPDGLQKAFEPAHRIPVGRYGEHQELANLTAYLLSPFAAYINGECVTIDGGEWLRGAGQFNFLEELTGEEWDEMQKRKGG